MYLVGAFVGIVITSLITVGMFARGWGNRGQAYHLVWGLTSLLDSGSYALFVMPIGVYLGLVIVAAFDYFKRVQGLLLVIGTALAGFGLAARGLLTSIPWLSLTTFGLFVVGILVGMVWLGGARSALSNGRPLQFPQAYRSLFALVTIITVLGFVEAHVLYQPVLVSGFDEIVFHQFHVDGIEGSSLFIDLFGSIGLIFLMWWFTGHESEKEVVIIGPTGSGKTWLLGGLNYVLEEENQYDPNAIPTRAEGAVQETTGKMRARNFDAIESTDEGRRLGFQFVHGDLLKQRVKVKSLDYSGEALQYFETLDPSEDDIEADNLEEALELAVGVAQARPLGARLSEIVYHADCVGMAVPLDQHAQNAINRSTIPDYLDPNNLLTRARMDKSEYHSKYENIANNYEDKDMFLIATMADIAKEDYESTVGTTAVTEWYDFREHVTKQFTMPEIQGTRQYLNGDDRLVHPIYFKVDPDDPKTPAGNIKPDLDPDDGFPGLRRTDELLNRIGR